MIRKFKVEVVRTDKYTIEIDDEVLNDEWMENFKQFMYDFDTLEEHVIHIAQYRARFDNGSFYGGHPEGYGEIAIKGKIRQDTKWPFPAINIAEADEDNEIEVDVKEIK
ncbi:hypothetical protein SFC08_02010 [Lysinibacillus halotolerans]